jgi:hypothetical protein
MKRLKVIAAGLCVVLAAEVLFASGPVGVFAVLEKVVFEPNEANAERVQVWGAFAFVDGGITVNVATSKPQRGYLYFTMPAAATGAEMKIARTEWSDLKAVAGTGQVVAFGNWGYIGGFSREGGNEIFVTVPNPNRAGSYQGIKLDVLNRTPADVQNAAPYVTNTGIVKLPETGNHAAIVKQLRDALRRQ